MIFEERLRVCETLPYHLAEDQPRLVVVVYRWSLSSSAPKYTDACSRSQSSLVNFESDWARVRSVFISPINSEVTVHWIQDHRERCTDSPPWLSSMHLSCFIAIQVNVRICPESLRWAVNSLRHSSVHMTSDCETDFIIITDFYSIRRNMNGCEEEHVHLSIRFGGKGVRSEENSWRCRMWIDSITGSSLFLIAHRARRTRTSDRFVLTWSLNTIQYSHSCSLLSRHSDMRLQSSSLSPIICEPDTVD